MSDPAKVVRLDVDAERVLKARLARLPSEIQALRDKSKVLLGENLKAFFDKLDDSLFDLADKAQSQGDQHAFFGSMRLLRVQRRAIEQQFLNSLDEGFARLETQPSGATGERTFTAETLTLVKNDDLEVQVAVDAMVAQAHRRFAETLGQVSYRMDSLVPVKVYAKNNPVGPDAICAALAAATGRLELDIKVRLVLLKTFDKQLMSELLNFYKSINQLLIDLKVQPTLRDMAEHSALPAAGQQARDLGLQGRVLVSGGVSARGEGVPAAGMREPTAQPVSFDEELAQLLNEMVRGVSAPTPGFLTSQTLSLASLVDVLSRVQREVKVSPGIADVRSLVAAFSDQRGFAAQLSRMDAELINLVSLLFEYIQNDQNLADPIKQLLSRLQIPIVKVALVDKGFFTQTGHVARRLLNTLAMAGVGWNGQVEDPLYKRIHSVVQRIVDSFEADTTLFGELLAEFGGFMDREKRRAALFERRVLDAEDGKLIADEARNRVTAEVGLRTQNFALSVEILDFIQGPWSSVLLVVGLKQGLDSPAWGENLQTLTELVWSLQPPHSPVERHTLIKLVPGLLTRLRAGLDLIAFNPFEMAKFFGSLEKQHMAFINAYAPQYNGAVPVTVAVAAVAPAPVAPAVDAISTDDLHWQQVAAFAQGSWFDFFDGQKPALRCRLAAVIRQTGNFIFVNRSGVKVTEKSHRELALALRAGTLRPLDSSMLFDRALEEVVSGLRKTNGMNLDLSEPPKKS